MPFQKKFYFSLNLKKQNIEWQNIKISLKWKSLHCFNNLFFFGLRPHIFYIASIFFSFQQNFQFLHTFICLQPTWNFWFRVGICLILHSVEKYQFWFSLDIFWWILNFSRIYDSKRQENKYIILFNKFFFVTSIWWYETRQFLWSYNSTEWHLGFGVKWTIQCV